MKLIITVDTEADNQWKKEKLVTLENIFYLPRFQELAQRFGFIPTYLVTYEVAVNSEAASILSQFQKGGNAEIGAHLHPWTTPPYQKDTAWERKYHRFPSELSFEELDEKMRTLTEAIKENFGESPTSFRAGRWGLSPKVVKVLKELNYTADSSVTPGISWHKTKGDPKGLGGPDFRHAPLFPYEISNDNILSQGESGIVEIPVTILPTGGIIERIVRQATGHPRWFRIFPETTLNDLKIVYKAVLCKHLPYIQFMIHSSELMPGGSPYAKDENAMERTFGLIRDLFSFLKEQQVDGVTISQFALSLKKVKNES
ncbi:MAG: hypothetical protein A3E94_01225 [Candidatus Zambryskibacteria bacterium RIFCSPHIGHO2_12_FULL_44_12b]|uniref:NodB homology domain-containing protein n=1 Tax=Candidatus Zambryskibacteria bacterium RIFCSPLOWO2_01_FULL_45_21 TaxID=1802761 RepID=A0A1G2U1U7_9BACT|nr:MAG: hypothetical protein A3E94_01225 [Candidatus Zambryskibacteria bacterium RIFCSPHIGHO2_12_FULL_44_12b]OHB03454.1 MAG: hypothetical protein A3B14_02905 [Candidatus Zambryskibacteria bacterium RIFCSPLOWO2_01_FULL_45_21]